MATRIQIRRDTEANWNSVDPVLAQGELGLNLDTNQIKIGDGLTAWNSLSYTNLALDINDLDGVTITDAQNGDFLRYSSSASAWINDPVNLSTDTVGDYVQSLVAGTGVSLENNSGEGATPTIAIGQAVSTSSSVTFGHVSAPVTGNVTGDLTGNADTATTLETTRVISLGGDLSGSVSFDGSSDVTITATVQPDSVALGTDTTGNFMSDVVAGTGVTVTHTPGESSSASIAIGQDVATSASVTFAHVSAELTGNVTGDLTGNSSSATALETSRTISLSGDLSGSVSFDGTADVTISATVQPDSVALGTDTTGNYVNDVTAGTGVTVTHTPGEGSSPTIAIGQAVGTSASVTFAHVAADLTGDVTGNADTATALQNARVIALSGDVSGSVSFDGTGNVDISTTIGANSVALGTDTSGDYVSSLVAGTGVSLANNGGETATPTISIGQDVATSASVTFAKVDTTGDVTVGGNLTVNGTTTTLNTETLSVEDNIVVLNSNTTGSPTLNAGIEIERGDSANVVLRWNESTDKWETTNDGAAYSVIATNGNIALGTDTTGNYMSDVTASTGVTISHTPGEGSTATFSIGQPVGTSASVTFANVSADLVGNVTGNVTGDLTGNADTAAALETARTISIGGDVSGSVSFDGTADVSISATIQPNSVALGADTSGDYVSSLVAGTGVAITNNSGETATPTIAIGQAVGTSASVTFAHVSSPVTGNVTGDLTGNADTATALETARTIELSGDVSGSASFDGTSNINIFTTVNTASVAIGELGGVNISSPGEYQVLQYDGTQWINDYPDTVSYVRNVDTVTLTSGTAVYIFGGNGDHATVKRADNSSDATSSKTIGLVGASTAQNENGPIVTRGYVDGINLSAGYNVGDVLWLGKNGAFTTTKPSAPDHLVFLGVVIRATENGIVYVATQNGYELEELHNVKINGVTDGQFLRYNSASTVWVNDTINLGTDTAGDYVQSLTAGTGVILSNNSGETATPTVAIGQDVATSASVTFAHLIVQGDMEVQGTITRLDETNLDVESAFIYLNATSASANPDMGVAFNYNDGTYRHAGFFRDSSDGIFKVFDGYEPEPVSPINTSDATYSDARFQAESIILTQTTGTAPMSVSSSTVVTNFNADKLDGQDGSYYAPIDSPTFTGTVSLPNNTVALGTQTTGNYIADVSGGTGVTINHTPGEGTTPSVAIGQDVATSASVTFAAVTAPVVGNSSTASTLQTPRTISLSGDVSGSVSFNGSSNVDISATIQPNSVALGTDTTGNYVNDLTAGTGVIITHTPGEGSSPTVAIGQAVETSASVTFANVSADLVGNVTGNLTGDVAGNADTATSLETARTISLGGDLSGSASFDGTSNVTITATVQPDSVALGTDTTGNFMSDVVGGTGVTVSHTPGESSSASVSIGQDVATSASVTFAAVTAPVVGNVAGDLTGNADTATALETARTISLTGDVSGSVSFDGTGDVSITATVQPDSVALGTDTTGNYVNDLTGGTGVTITHTPGEGSNPTVAIGQSVATSASVTFAQVDTTGDVVVGGNLTVNGTTTTLNTETLAIEDNIIVLNNGVTGSPTANAGIEVERGTSANVALRWNETSDKWELTEDGATYSEISTADDVSAITISILDDIGDVSASAAVSGDFLKYDGAQWVNDQIDLGTDTVGNYVNDVTAGTGVTVTHTPGEGSSPTIAIGQAVETSSSVQFAAVTAPLIGNVTGNADTATALATSRTIELTGDVTGSVSFNGSANASITATISANSVALGTDTTGNYVADVVSGTGITISHTPGEGSSASVALNATLDDLSNVTAPSPSDGQFLKYVSASTAWVPAAIPTINALDDIGDVSAASPNTGDLLIWSGSAWANSTSLSRPSITNPNLGYSTTSTSGGSTSLDFTSNYRQFFTGTSTHTVVMPEVYNMMLGYTYEIHNDSTQSITIDANHGGTIATLAAGETALITCIFPFNFGTPWSVDIIASAAINALDDIGDVNAPSPTTGYFLKWDGSAWVPAAAGAAATTTSITANTETTIASFDKDVANAAEFTVKVEQGNRFLSNKVLVLHNGTDADFTKYGEISIAATETVAAAVTWTTQTSNFADSNIYSVAYGNNLWVAAGGNNGQLCTSTDGTTWTTRTSNFGYANILSVAYDNNLWVAGGFDQIRTSTDAITWTTQTSNFGAYDAILSVAYGNNLWVAGGYGGVLRTSTDAVTWTTRTSNFGNTAIYSLAYGNNLWVAGGYGGELRTSTDAITWTTQTSNFGNTSVNSVAYGNNLWVAGGGDSIGSGEIRTSTDAITWTTRTSNFGNYSVNSVAYGNSLWVAGGNNSQIRTSTDAITWVTQTSNFGPYERIFSVAYGNNLWVAAGGPVGTAGEIRTSPVETASVEIPLTLSADISGSDVRLRATITDAATTTATTKVLKTLVEE